VGVTTESLDGLVVVITGGARGIGRAVAAEFLAAGARVAAVDRSWAGNGAEDTARSLGDTGRVLTLTADITDEASVAASLEQVLARFGQVDVLINNAACRQRYLFSPTGLASVLETTRADWDAMLGVNVHGTLNVIRAYVTPMLERGRGSIINVGTRGSVLPPAGPGVWRGQHPGLRNQPYEASKAAMCSMSVFLAEELREAGVAVNVVFPGATFTTGSAEIAEGRRRDGIVERPYLRPEHLAPVMKHLAAAVPTGETGQVTDTGLVIDAVQWNRDHGFGDDEQWWYRA
jgi:NAD(P)-dependent dehydrogenase (short-subunit alcohol dehydrogenase family)